MIQRPRLLAQRFSLSSPCLSATAYQKPAPRRVPAVLGRLRIDMADGAVTVDPQNFAIYSSAQAFSYTNVGDEIARFTRVVV